MRKTKLTAKLFLIEPQKAKLLALLASETGILQSVLVRKAIDQMLVRYGKLPALGKRRPRVSESVASSPALSSRHTRQ